MTPTSTQAHPLTLDPATFHTMISTTVDCLPYHPKASPEEIANLQQAAFLVIASLSPRDPQEAMLAARIVATHAHLMDDFRNAAQLDLPPNLQLRYQGRAIALCRVMDTTLREFWNRQTAPARRPLGLPAAVSPAPRPEPAQEAAHTAPPPTSPQATTPQKTAPAPRPATPAPTPEKATTPATRPAASTPDSLDPATLAQLIAEVDARLETSLTALAA